MNKQFHIAFRALSLFLLFALLLGLIGCQGEKEYTVTDTEFYNVTAKRTTTTTLLSMQGGIKSVEYNITPAYPVANDLSSFGPFGEIYTFELKTPVKGDGIRLIGTPGGYQKLISCGELEVYA